MPSLPKAILFSCYPQISCALGLFEVRSQPQSRWLRKEPPCQVIFGGRYLSPVSPPQQPPTFDHSSAFLLVSLDVISINVDFSRTTPPVLTKKVFPMEFVVFIILLHHSLHSPYLRYLRRLHSRAVNTIPLLSLILLALPFAYALDKPNYSPSAKRGLVYVDADVPADHQAFVQPGNDLTW